MNVGILVWDLNISGGTQRQALELAAHLADLGIKVVVYTYLYDPHACYPGLSSRLDIRFVKVKAVEDVPSRVAQTWNSIRKYWRIYFELDSQALLSLIEHDTDVLTPVDYRVYVAAGRWKARTGKPVVWLMNDMPMYRWNRQQLLKTVLFHLKPKFREHVRSFDKVVVLDEWNKRQLEQTFQRPAEVLRSGIDVEIFTFLTRKRQPGCFRLLSTGIFLPHRRIEDTVEALCMLSRKGCKIRLDYVGSPDRGMSYARKIYKLVARLNLQDSVVFHGRVSDDDLLRLFTAADAFVFPNAPQTWGLSVFEAMATGLPVITTTGCGAAEVLKDGVNALIVEPYRPDLLAAAIERLYEDPSLGERLAHNGRAYVENYLSWRHYATEMIAKYHEVLKVDHVGVT